MSAPAEFISTKAPRQIHVSATGWGSVPRREATIRMELKTAEALGKEASKSRCEHCAGTLCTRSEPETAFTHNERAFDPNWTTAVFNTAIPENGIRVVTTVVELDGFVFDITVRPLHFAPSVVVAPATVAEAAGESISGGGGLG